MESKTTGSTSIAPAAPSLQDTVDKSTASLSKPTIPAAMHGVCAANADRAATGTEAAPACPEPAQAAALAANLGGKFEELGVNEHSACQKPLQFLDLPVDVLEEVVKQIGASNDLISLAVCNSWLHAIVMPHMYSRFDIVWPEPGEETDSRPGVDALAYGLGTLVMSGALYGPQHDAVRRCSGCGRPSAEQDGRSKDVQLVSNYAQFVRKFAIGNGPANSVAAYNYSTEGGKMLGTLVALALARMTNLEIFFWDMPTGIVREVWTALSSLGYTRNGRPKQCSLSSIWVRCHDSKKIPRPSQIAPLSSVVQTFSARPDTLKASYTHVEHPSFSALPPLQKIGVVEIDEVAYFEELAQLIEKSQDKLRELRIGASRTSRLVEAESDGPGYYNEPSTTCLGAGGVLGMLMSRIHDCRRLVTGTQKPLRRQEASSNLSGSTIAGSGVAGAAGGFSSTQIPTASTGLNNQKSDVNSIPSLEASGVPDPPITPEAQATTQLIGQNEQTSPPKQRSEEAWNRGDQHRALNRPSTASAAGDQNAEEKKLSLNILELENITIASFVLRYSLDWSRLTQLTLLNCALDEVFWGDLRSDFAPTPKANVKAGAKPTALTHDFPLKLRKVHVDGVSTSMIATLRDCLAPNTLECLFLQDRHDYQPSSKVTVDAIYKSVLRRHRESLQKLSIDSQYKYQHTLVSYEKWLLNRDVLAFICSGKMPQLRELAVSIAYDDWHYLLTHLPNLPHLRSIYLPHILDYPGPGYLNPREIAMQVLDIVTLRPEIEICYIGIQHKCFEILEGRKAELEAEMAVVPETEVAGYGAWGDPLGEDSTDSDSDDEFFQPSTAEVVEEHTETEMAQNSEPESDSSSENEEDSGPSSGKNPKLRLREILFYTEKVEIFKVERGTIFFTT